jgi:hypothetical protein
VFLVIVIHMEIHAANGPTGGSIAPLLPATGDTVVHEAPLLHVPQLKPSSPLYSPLNAYFERTHIPASVVLKILAFFTADPDAQAATLQCAAPEEAAFAAAPIVQQAKLFAATLLADPPLPDFVAQVDAYLHRQKQEQQEEDQQPGGHCITAVGPPPSAAPLRRPPPPTDAAGLLTRLWLVWVCNGHALRGGSALFEHGSKLTHTCGAANTAYRTAAGAPAPVHGLAPAEPAGTITTSSAAAARGAAAPGSAAAPAGYHVAQGAVLAGDLLTTNYLGSGHRRLLSTPARQRLLADKFLFHCDCLRCEDYAHFNAHFTAHFGCVLPCILPQCLKRFDMHLKATRMNAPTHMHTVRTTRHTLLLAAD